MMKSKNVFNNLVFYGIGAMLFICAVGCTGMSKYQRREDERMAERERQAMAEYNPTKYLIESSLLEEDELTDGRVIFKKPRNSKISKILNDDELPKGDFSYHIEGRSAPWEIIVCSFVDNPEFTGAEFAEIAGDWKPDWASGLNETIVSVDDESTSERRIFKRKAQLSGKNINTLIWNFIAVQDQTTEKLCIITAFSTRGTNIPLDTILNSLKFYNTVEK